MRMTHERFRQVQTFGYAPPFQQLLRVAAFSPSPMAPYGAVDGGDADQRASAFDADGGPRSDDAAWMGGPRRAARWWKKGAAALTAAAPNRSLPPAPPRRSSRSSSPPSRNAARARFRARARTRPWRAMTRIAWSEKPRRRKTR